MSKDSEIFVESNELIKTTTYLTPKIYSKIDKLAKKEKRSIAKQIDYILTSFIQNREFCGKFDSELGV